MGGFRWLIDIETSAMAGRVLYAIPHAGAGAVAVKVMCRDLADTFDTVAVRLPGRESLISDEPITEMNLIADMLAAQVASDADGRRIFLYGHCSGATIAYEVARRLPPSHVGHLIVSSQQAPGRVPVTGAWRLPRDAFLAQVAADGYLPEAVVSEPELIELVEPALRADYEAVETHYCASWEVIAVPVLALLGTREHVVTKEDIAAWSQVTSGGFLLEFLSGGHNLLLDQPAEVAAVIRTVTMGG